MRVGAIPRLPFPLFVSADIEQPLLLPCCQASVTSGGVWGQRGGMTLTPALSGPIPPLCLKISSAPPAQGLLWVCRSCLQVFCSVFVCLGQPWVPRNFILLYLDVVENKSRIAQHPLPRHLTEGPEASLTALKWLYHGITGPSPVFLGLFVFSGGAGMGGRSLSQRKTELRAVSPVPEVREACFGTRCPITLSRPSLDAEPRRYDEDV